MLALKSNFHAAGDVLKLLKDREEGQEITTCHKKSELLHNVLVFLGSFALLMIGI